jgi:hypothetical protein
MNTPSPRTALRAEALCVSYALPTPLRAKPQPARQVASGLVHKHLFLSGDTAVGLIAFGPGDARQPELSNEVLLAAVPVVGRITDLQKQGEPYTWDGRAGMRWKIQFALDGTPRSAEIFVLPVDASRPDKVLTVSSWGEPTQAATADAVVGSLTATHGMNPVRKASLWHIGIGAVLLLLGVLASAISYAAAESRSAHSGFVEEYTMRVGLVAVGVFLIGQGLWKLLFSSS